MTDWVRVVRLTSSNWQERPIAALRQRGEFFTPVPSCRPDRPRADLSWDGQRCDAASLKRLSVISRGMNWKCQGPQCGTQQRFGQSIIAFYSRDMIGSEACELEYVTETGRLAIRPDHLSARCANPTVGDRVFDDNLRRRSFSWQGLQKSCSPHDLPGGCGLPCHRWIEGFWVAYAGFQGDRDIFNEAILRRVSAIRAADNSGHLCPHFSGRAPQRRLDTRDVNLLHLQHRGLCAGRCGPVRV